VADDERAPLLSGGSYAGLKLVFGS